MKRYNIALIKGDGIGPEIIDEAVKVLDAVAADEDFDSLMKSCLWADALMILQVIHFQKRL